MPKPPTTAAPQWHHAVLTTYGAWLPGDARGYRTLHHRGDVDGDYRSPPPVGKYSALERSARASLVQTPVKLDVRKRPQVGMALQARLDQLGAWVLCLSVSRQHVHLLVKLPGGEARKWLGLAKKHATFVLKSQGWEGKLWGVRSRVERVSTRAHQVRTYRYILRHREEGAWIGVWNDDNFGRREP